MATIRIEKLNPARLDRLDKVEEHNLILPQQDASGVMFWKEGRWRAVWDDSGEEGLYMPSIHKGWLVIAPPAPRETAPEIWYETQRTIALERLRRKQRSNLESCRWEGQR